MTGWFKSVIFNRKYIDSFMLEKIPSDRQAAMLMLDLSIVKRRDHWTIVTQNGSSEVVVPRLLIPSKYYSFQGWCLGCLGCLCLFLVRFLVVRLQDHEVRMCFDMF